jgi:hypothetical protein
MRLNDLDIVRFSKPSEHEEFSDTHFLLYQVYLSDHVSRTAQVLQSSKGISYASILELDAKWRSCFEELLGVPAELDEKMEMNFSGSSCGYLFATISRCSLLTVALGKRCMLFATFHNRVCAFPILSFGSKGRTNSFFNSFYVSIGHTCELELDCLRAKSLEL